MDTPGEIQGLNCEANQRIDQAPTSAANSQIWTLNSQDQGSTKAENLFQQRLQKAKQLRAQARKIAQDTGFWGIKIKTSV